MKKENCAHIVKCQNHKRKHEVIAPAQLLPIDNERRCHGKWQGQVWWCGSLVAFSTLVTRQSGKMVFGWGGQQDQWEDDEGNALDESR